MTRLRLPSLISIAATGVALAACPSGARAGTFTVSSCTLAQPTAAPWTWVRTTRWLWTSESCGPVPGTTFISGMWAYPNYADGGGAFDSTARWRFTVAGPLVIRRVRGEIAFKQAGGLWAGLTDDSAGRW